MKRTIHALLTTIAIMSLMLVALAGCATAQATFADEPKEQVEFHYVCDWGKTEPPVGCTRVLAEQRAREAAEAEQQAEVDNSPADGETWAYSGSEGYDESLNNNPSYSGAYVGDGFKQQGVRDFNGRTETWYSSNQAYHYRTGEWTADSEGYYRDSDGNYVVAASDMPEGATFEGSKGTCKVYDSGCDDGVTDYYVNY